MSTSPHTVAPVARRSLSMAHFAKAVDVERSTITRACKPGKPLAPAVKGGRIQLDHEAVESWLVDRGLGLEVFDGAAPRPSSDIAADLGPSAGLSLDQIESLTLRQLTDRHGGAEPFYMWVRARKELAMARRAEEQLARLQGKLIPRTLVEHIFGLLDGLTRRLLQDAARNISVQVAPHDRERAEAIVRDQISQQLTVAKDQARRTLLADDPTAPLKDPAPPKERDVPLALALSALQMVRTRLAADAAPALAEMFTKPAAPRDPRAIANILGAHVDRATRDLHTRVAIGPEQTP